MSRGSLRAGWGSGMAGARTLALEHSDGSSTQFDDYLDKALNMNPDELEADLRRMDTLLLERQREFASSTHDFASAVSNGPVTLTQREMVQKWAGLDDGTSHLLACKVSLSKKEFDAALKYFVAINLGMEGDVHNAEYEYEQCQTQIQSHYLSELMATTYSVEGMQQRDSILDKLSCLTPVSDVWEKYAERRHRDVVQDLPWLVVQNTEPTSPKKKSKSPRSPKSKKGRRGSMMAVNKVSVELLSKFGDILCDYVRSDLPILDRRFREIGNVKYLLRVLYVEAYAEVVARLLMQIHVESGGSVIEKVAQVISLVRAHMNALDGVLREVVPLPPWSGVSPFLGDIIEAEKPALEATLKSEHEKFLDKAVKMWMYRSSFPVAVEYEKQQEKPRDVGEGAVLIHKFIVRIIPLLPLLIDQVSACVHTVVKATAGTLRPLGDTASSSPKEYALAITNAIMLKATLTQYLPETDMTPFFPTMRLLDDTINSSTKALVDMVVMNVKRCVISDLAKVKWVSFQNPTKEKRCNYGIQMWGFYMRSVAFDLFHSPLPLEVCRVVYEESLIQGLQSIVALYSRVQPSRGMAVQLGIDTKCLVAVGRYLCRFLLRFDELHPVPASIRCLLHVALANAALAICPLEVAILTAKRLVEGKIDPHVLGDYNGNGCESVWGSGEVMPIAPDFDPQDQTRLTAGMKMEELVACEIDWLLVLDPCPLEAEALLEALQRRTEFRVKDYPPLSQQQEHSTENLRVYIEQLRLKYGLNLTPLIGEVPAAMNPIHRDNDTSLMVGVSTGPLLPTAIEGDALDKRLGNL